MRTATPTPAATAPAPASQQDVLSRALAPGHGPFFTVEEHNALVEAGAMLFLTETPYTSRTNGSVIPVGAKLFAVPVAVAGTTPDGLYVLPTGGPSTANPSAAGFRYGGVEDVEAAPAGAFRVMYSMVNYDNL